MSLLRRGIISSGKLDAGGPTTYAASTAVLNGTSQYFTLADSGDNFTSCSFFTRVKTTQATTGRLLSASSNTMIFDVRSGNSLVFAEGATAETYVNASIFDGNWHTVGFTVDGTAFKIYLDGVNVHSATITGMSSKDFEANIYRASTAAAYFNGSTAFTYFTRSVLSKSYIDEISDVNAKCFGDLSSGLQADLTTNGSCWDLANWSGHTSQETTDQTGNSNTLTNVGSIGFTGTGLTVEC